MVTAGDTRRRSARVSERTDQVHVGMCRFSGAADRMASLQIDWKPFLNKKTVAVKGPLLASLTGC